jgi:hypothetical protein
VRLFRIFLLDYDLNISATTRLFLHMILIVHFLFFGLCGCSTHVQHFNKFLYCLPRLVGLAVGGLGPIWSIISTLGSLAFRPLVGFAAGAEITLSMPLFFGALRVRVAGMTRRLDFDGRWPQRNGNV